MARATRAIVQAKINPKAELYYKPKPVGFTQLRPYKHQRKVTSLQNQSSNIVFDTSDAGTGKTYAHLIAWHKRRQEGGGKALILCPKSIMFAAWANDVLKFFPGDYTVSIAGAKQKFDAFVPEAQIVVMNHDGVKWLVKDKRWSTFLEDFDTLIIDESEAFKNHTSQRSKAASILANQFEYRAVLSATPFNKSVTELWHQIYLLDRGALLGKSFFQFRNAVCTPIQKGPRPEMREWQDKPGIDQEIALILQSITVRNKFEECLDIPDNVVRTIPFHLTPKHMSVYETMKEDAVLELNEGDVTAVNAAVLANKLLQVASGSVYTEDSTAVVVDTERYELITELVTEREHSLVFFQWTHQRDALKQYFDKGGITYEIIDGTVSDRRRKEIVEGYQAGDFKTLLLHPKSAGHGLTLTKGTATIWASPVYSPALFEQANHRIYRAGQTKKTETILIEAVGTVEQRINDILSQRLGKMENLLELLS